VTSEHWAHRPSVGCQRLTKCWGQNIPSTTRAKVDRPENITRAPPWEPPGMDGTLFARLRGEEARRRTGAVQPFEPVRRRSGHQPPPPETTRPFLTRVVNSAVPLEGAGT
jgi:hypothetical protein